VKGLTISKGNLSRTPINGFDRGAPVASACNTETIDIVATHTGSARDTNLIIDEGGGRFAPGITGAAAFPACGTEGTGMNEIEFVIFNDDKRRPRIAPRHSLLRRPGPTRCGLNKASTHGPTAHRQPRQS
jgi:hypothetical protein